MPPAIKKRPREPDSDMAGPAATSERPKATAADAADGGPARKKEEKERRRRQEISF